MALSLKNPDYLTLLERDDVPNTPDETSREGGNLAVPLGVSLAVPLAVPLAAPLGVPLAYLIGWQIGEDVELARIGVAPEARGQGRATRILAAALRVWRTAGAQNVWLEVRESNLAACGLYRGCGFVQVASRANYYADGETALILRFRFAGSSIPQ